MGVTATIVAVTHPFEVINNTKISAIICGEDVTPQNHRYINGPYDAETEESLKCWGRPEVMLCHMLLPRFRFRCCLGRGGSGGCRGEWGGLFFGGRVRC